MSAAASDVTARREPFHGLPADYHIDIVGNQRDRGHFAVVSRYLTAATVLCDIGCASGAWLEIFAAKIASGVGVDYSPEQLAKARQRLAGVRNVELRHEDATQLTLPSARFDVVISFDTLVLIPDVDAALGQIARILRPGGAAILGIMGKRNLGGRYWQRWHREHGRFGASMFTREELAASLDRHGMDLVEAVSLGGVLTQVQFLPGLRRSALVMPYVGPLDRWVSRLSFLSPYAGGWRVVACRRRS